MAFSVSPSVIVREVDASAAIPAIATPPAAIAGVFNWGPTNEPVLITSENQLVDRFGKPKDTNYETFFTAADYLSYANALYVTRADVTGSAKADSFDIVLFPANTIIANTDVSGTVDTANSTFGAFEAKHKGAIGNSLEVAYVKGANFEDAVLDVGDIPEQTILYSGSPTDQTISFAQNEVNFQVANTNQITTVNVGDRVVIGNDTVGYQELELSVITETALDGSGNPTANTLAIEVYEYDMTFTSNYTLSATNLNELKISRKWKYSYLFGKAADTNNYHIAVVDRDGGISGVPGSVLERFDNLSTTPGTTLSDGRINYYPDVMENLSAWVSVANTTYFEASTNEYETLSGGSDGTAEGSASFGAVALAYDTFINANEIDVQFVLQGKGDDAGNVANYIVSNIAESRRDCVAFISPSKEAVVDELKTAAKQSNVIAYRNKVQSSSYSFMDSGYKYRYDKYNDKYRWVPLNGDMAGLCSRVEPYESPAGFRKGIIKNVVKLAFNPNKTQRDQLYGSDINPVISQVGQGILLFGDKTTQGFASAFDRINVRRLFIAVEKSIATAAESFLFELNDEFTQTQFRNIVEPFLRDIQGRRGITDFRVISDETVNTPQVIDANMFRANIFIKPARSINVIELTFVATRSGVEFDEIVGQLT